jgi:hypothetical protein
MNDDQIEDMVRDLIEQHVADPDRKAALKWLTSHAIVYKASARLGLVPDDLAGARLKRRPPGKGDGS